jgi:hypothetical protein
MPGPMRFPWIHRLASLALALGSLAAFGLIVRGGYGISQASSSGPVEIMLGAAILGMVGLFYGLLMVALKVESATYRIHTVAFDLHEMLQRLQDPVRMIADNSQISDIAKSIAHREKERDALRQAIREDIFKPDWEAAYYLIDEMERRFGYREESERLRQEVDDSRQMSIAAKIDQAIAHVERILEQADWDRARQESDRLSRLFPNNDKIRRLPDAIEDRRQQHKRKLLQMWYELVQKNAIDQAIELLKDLDSYLTRNEAKGLEETVRGVFKAKLAQIGVKFSLAVSEKRWSDALEVGVQIIEEFPNSQMAKEVSSNLDALRRRAGMIADAEIIEQRAPRPAGE